MTNAATDLTRLPTPPRSGSWTRPFTWAIAGVFAVIVVAALAVAAAAAALVGLLVAVAARLAPRRHGAGPVTLEGRRTADGWDVEAAAPR